MVKDVSVIYSNLKYFVQLGFHASIVSACILLPVHAGQCSLVPSGVANIEETERADLLSDFKFQDLEKELAKQHKKNIASEGKDLLTLRDIVGLQQFAREENLMRMWVDQQPQSFFAQLNAGVFYGNKAFAARGNSAAINVNSSQWRVAKKLSETAQTYLTKAMTLEPRSALPHAMMIGLAAIENQAGGRTAEQWLQAANQIDPKNLAARINAINYLSPRWGGSYEMLEQMVAQAGQSLPAASVNYLQYNLVFEKASYQEGIKKDNTKAQALYKQAKSMCENSEAALSGISRTYQ